MQLMMFRFIYALVYPALLGSMLYDLFAWRFPQSSLSQQELSELCQLSMENLNHVCQLSQQEPITSWHLFMQVCIMGIYMADWWYTTQAYYIKNDHEEVEAIKPERSLLLSAFGPKKNPNSQQTFARVAVAGIDFFSAMVFVVSFKLVGIGDTRSAVVLLGMTLFLYVVFHFFMLCCHKGFQAEFFILLFLLIYTGFVFGRHSEDWNNWLPLIILVSYVFLDISRSKNRFLVT